MKVLDYEQLVLGSVLVDSRAIQKLSTHLATDRFSTDEHKLIYDTALDIYRGSMGTKPVDVGSMALTLGSSLDKIGGLPYLTLLANKLQSIGVMSTHGLETWATVVDQCGRLRHISLVASEYADKFNKYVADVEVAVDVDSVIAEFMQDIRASQSVGPSGYRPITEGVDEFQSRLRLAASGQPTDVLSTGFLSLDSMLAGGLPRGGLVILCGLSSDGKTSLALQIAQNVATNIQRKQSKGRVLVNSLEMKHWRLVQRLASASAEVDTRLITAGQIKPDSDEFKRLMAESERIRALPIHIDESFGTSTSIQYHAAMQLSEAPVVLVEIDFAELVGDEAKTEELRVSKIFINAKQLAKMTGATVIILAQYNRAVDLRPDMLGRRGDIRYCVAGDALIPDAVSGRCFTARDLSTIPQNIARVWAHTDAGFTPADFSIGESGVQSIYRVATKSGFSTRVSGGHPLLTKTGWIDTNKLAVGNSIMIAPYIISTGFSGRTLLPHDEHAAWDEIVSIEIQPAEMTYDLTVPGPENFIVDGIVSHNSGMAEHVADLILHIYNPIQRELSGHQIITPREMPALWIDKPNCGHVYVFADKNRDGPVGVTTMMWTPIFTKFSDLSAIKARMVADEF